MNKRIKDITEQATRWSGSVESVEVFDKEKFAELIVQECLNAIAASHDRPKLDKDYAMFYAGLFTAIDAIKQRFGYK